jgi:hypothetical protein
MTMRNRILAAAVMAGVAGIATSALAQNTVIIREDPGTVGVAVEDPGILPAQRRAFRTYVIEQDIPDYEVSEEIVVGRVLPEVGVTYYDVPQQFGATTYRYTMVNNRTVLVDPRTRRIMQVLD